MRIDAMKNTQIMTINIYNTDDNNIILEGRLVNKRVSNGSSISKKYASNCMILNSINLRLIISMPRMTILNVEPELRGESLRASQDLKNELRKLVGIELTSSFKKDISAVINIGLVDISVQSLLFIMCETFFVQLSNLN